MVSTFTHWFRQSPELTLVAGGRVHEGESVVLVAASLQVPVGPAMIGRNLDGLGNCLAGEPIESGTTALKMAAPAPALARYHPALPQPLLVCTPHLILCPGLAAAAAPSQVHPVLLPLSPLMLPARPPSFSSIDPSRTILCLFGSLVVESVGASGLKWPGSYSRGCQHWTLLLRSA